MGKGEIKEQRMYLTLIYKGEPVGFINLGQVIFKIPANAPAREQVEILAEQVESWLTVVSNVCESYDVAIKTVENWLKGLIGTHADRKIWVEMGADMAGVKFMAKVKESKQKRGVIAINLRKLLMGGIHG